MAKKPKLKALFFDVDDTLYSSTDFAANARRQAAQAMVRAGLKVDEETILRELDEIIVEFGSNDDRHFDKLLRRMPKEAYPVGSKLFIIGAGIIAYHQCKFRSFSPYEDAIEVMRRLHEKRLTLGVITAGVPMKQVEKIIRLNLLPMMDYPHIFITESVGINKTNPKIYMHASRSVGATPQECGYVGDKPSVDIDVPHRIGMRTFLSRRGTKYQDIPGEAEPDHIIHNFWDLMDILEKEYEIVPHA
ncbi:MAG: HAD hydrolase-like protein [Planctomycetaceae bacterium]|nr:HAD hydrolase-like protein [Planctomycetaceae bacterium]